MLGELNRPNAIWDTVLTATRLHCDEGIYENLIMQARLDDYDARHESVVIQIPRGVSRVQFQQRAVPPLKKAFANAIGVRPTIYIEEIDHVSHSSTSSPASRPSKASVRTGKSQSSTAAPAKTHPFLRPDYTFDSFVIGPGNRLAEAAARAVVDGPGKTYNPLFIHGAVGLGKTHLLQAICHAMLERDPEMNVRFLSCEQFVNDYVDALAAGKQQQFRSTFRGIDLLVVDDIHFLRGKEATQEEFFHTFNDLFNAGKQIVISSDAPPRDIPELEERLISRFLWGLPVKIESPCTETREAIIADKAKRRGLNLSNDVVRFIAETIKSNIRELEGALTQVAARADMLDRPITLTVAREALKDLVTISISRRITIDDIVDVTCRHFDVRLSDLQSARRSRSVTVPRQVAMYLAKNLTQKTLSEIGGFFGGRDHSTVLHSIRKVTKQVENEADIEQQITMLQAELGVE